MYTITGNGHNYRYDPPDAGAEIRADAANAVGLGFGLAWSESGRSIQDVGPRPRHTARAPLIVDLDATLVDPVPTQVSATTPPLR